MSTPPSPPAGSFLRTVRTVAWGLLGVRGHKPAEHDARPLSPLQIVLTALAFMLVFVITLVTLAISVSRQ